MLRSIDVTGYAGMAFGGRYLFEIAGDRSQKIDPKTGRVVATTPGRDSGLAWAEGTLWVGQYREQKIHQIDPETGAILRTIESNRFVTHVSWVDGELWHGTWEGDESDVRRVDPGTGEVLEQLEMSRGVSVSGLESDGGVLLWRGAERQGTDRPPTEAEFRGQSLKRSGGMATHKVVKHDEWLKARKRHQAKEKEFTRMRDQLSRERRELPWELVEKHYTFEGEHGSRTLGDLFEGRGQLVIYHAMFNPPTAGPHTPWTADAPCYVCSFWMDNFNGITIHLNHRDITMAAVSLAPYPKLAAYKERMGWGFPWWSSLGSDFNFDYRVSFTEEELSAKKVDYNYRLEPWAISEAPGISVFVKDGGQIYHTYSTYARGLDMLNVAYHYMDLVPKGRDEGDRGVDAWVRRRDEYPD